jgi:uncharacterized protein with NAD-binding domain and iron-sulfur cluster
LPDWAGASYDLVCGRDFDDVLLGISIAALPPICGELVEASPAWAAMLEKIETNRPTIVQTWQTRTLADLGFTLGVINGDIGTQPINLLTSMDQILTYEGWTGEAAPRSLIYYSGVLPDDPHEPPAPNPGYPATQQAIMRAAAVEFLERYAGVYLPNATSNGAFDWTVLACGRDPAARGAARFDEQYWRVNVEPTERYVLSVTGSSAYRMTAGGSGFKNLFLAGDWVETVLNAGCMEATVSAGLEAARAIAASDAPAVDGERSWRRVASGEPWTTAEVDPTR